LPNVIEDGAIFGAASRPVQVPDKQSSELTKDFFERSFSKPTHLSPLDSRNKKGTLFPICSHIVGSRTMLRMFVEEAAALASITLFVAMIAVWAQVIPQL